MKIRSIFVVDSGRPFFSLINDIATHLSSVEEVELFKDLPSLEQALLNTSSPTVILERTPSLTQKTLLTRIVPPHLKDQVSLIRVNGKCLSIEEQVLEGYDFCSPETFSLMQFEELLTKCSEKITFQVEARVSNALNLLGGEIGAQLDQVAYMKRKGYKAELSEIMLKEMASVIKDLSRKERDIFHTAFFKYCEEATPADGSLDLTKPYVGVSTRVRKKMSKKACSELQSAHHVLKKVASL